ncbi:vomeronasal type-2 receptor 26-like [Ascaphus truei]|uniref:vomeronasal type-2 receptor 26-like n=1 Tax=Ascaphus truei TaxID=8439 RepID=UPI003F59EDC8
MVPQSPVGACARSPFPPHSLEGITGVAECCANLALSPSILNLSLYLDSTLLLSPTSDLYLDSHLLYTPTSATHIDYSTSPTQDHGEYQHYPTSSTLNLSHDYRSAHRTHSHSCSVQPKYYRHFQALIFAIDEINRNPNLLPNITLGYQLFDSCSDEGKAVENVIRILYGAKEAVPNYDCLRRGKLAGFIGDLTSVTTLAAAKLLGIYGYTQVSYGATDPLLNDKSLFPTFFRTVPSNIPQYVAMAQLLLHFGWNWVGIMTSDDDAGEQESQQLKKEVTSLGICIEYIMKVHFNYKNQKFDSMLQEIQQTSSQVILMCGSPTAFTFLFFSKFFYAIERKTCILPATIVSLYLDENIVENDPLNGSLIFAFPSAKILGLKSVLESIHVTNPPQDMFVDDIFVKFFRCWPTDPNLYSRIDYEVYKEIMNITVCTGTEMLTFLSTFQYDTNTFRTTYNVYNAVYFLAHAMHEMHLPSLLTNPEKGLMDHDYRWKLHHHMKNIQFTNPVGEEMFFDEDGNAPGRYDILNYVISPLQHSDLFKVGSFDDSYPKEQQIILNKSAIRWNKYWKQVPRAVCSEPCTPGSHKTYPEGAPVCCYICVPCSKGEISNESDMEICTPCPEDQWPNEQRVRCIPKVSEFLSFEDLLGELLTFLSLLLSSLTVIVMMLCVRYRDTPIVKANNRDLSFVLLFSLMLSFLSALLFIGHPVDVTCMLRQPSFVIIFTVAVSSVLAKTVTVVIAFAATKPGSRLKKWVGTRLSHVIVIMSSSIQALICVIWLSISPPFQNVNMNSELDKILIECDEGSVVAFYSALGYMGLLASVSFIVAFLARTLPDSFNEAKYITFSMLVFCSVWVSFIPAYLSTKGKYLVTVEIFAILASGSGQLGCIFIPKCYVIIFKPELNTREHLMGRSNANM